MNKTIITQEYSQTKIQNILLSNKAISRTILVLKELNIKGYIYGKYVRDLLLGKYSNEIDILILGDVIEVAKNIKFLLGKRCILKPLKNAGKILITYSLTSKQQIYLLLTNTATISCDTKRKASNLTIEAFLSYRGLTVDSVAISLDLRKLGALINPFNGLRDIYNRYITTISDSQKTFRDNPILALKCFTLLTYPDFQLGPKCKKALKDNCLSYTFKENQKEIIEEMMLEIISSSNFSFILSEMHKIGFLSKLLPEVSALDTTEHKNGFTYRNDFIYTLKILEEVCQRTENISLRLITLFLYIGKMKAKKFDPIKGWTFHGTHFISAKMIPAILRRLGLYHELTHISYYEDMIIMFKNLRSLDVVNDSDSAIRRIITNAGEYLDDLLLLHNSYKKVQHQLKSTSPYTEDLLLKKRIERVLEVDNKIQCKDSLSINGHMIRDMYPKCTGRHIGLLKQKMARAVLDGKVSDNYKALLPLLHSYAKELGLKEKGEIENPTPNLIQETNVHKFTNCRFVQSEMSLTLFENGTFVIEDYKNNDNIPKTTLIKDLSQNMILQCYETGCVNKVCINEIFKLRKEFVFSNAIYKKALLQTVLLGSDKDFLMLKFQNENGGMIYIVPVSSIREHSMLGLKGTNIVQGYNILNWFIIRNCDESKIQEVFGTTSFPISVSLNEETTDKTACWIKEQMI